MSTTHLALILLTYCLLSAPAGAQGMRRRTLADRQDETNQQQQLDTRREQLKTAANFDAVADDCQTADKPYPTEMRYWKNFHPSDTLFDFYCKAQMIPGSGKFTVSLNGASKYSESFSFDGSPRVTRRQFARKIVPILQSYIEQESQGRFTDQRTLFQSLASFGIAPTSPAGQKAYLGTRVKLSFTGVDILNAPFELAGFFAATAEETASWLKGTTHPVEFPVLVHSGPPIRFRAPEPPAEVLVAMPLALTGMTLFSDSFALSTNESAKAPCGGDAACREADTRKEKIKSALAAKFGKYKSPGFTSPTRNAEGVAYSDAAITVVVEETTNHEMRFESGKSYDIKWLKVSYTPTENGPFQSKKSADEYRAVIAELKTRYPAPVEKKAPTNSFE